MSSIDLARQIESLPDRLKKEMEDHLQKLLFQEKKKKVGMEDLCGIFEGKIKMSDDFDEPLEDFKEYME